MIGIIRALNESSGRHFRPPHRRQNNSYKQSKNEGKDKESIETSTTPGLGHHMGKWLEDIQGTELWKVIFHATSEDLNNKSI